MTPKYIKKYIEINFNKYTKKYIPVYDNIKNKKFIKCCDILLLKEYKEFENIIEPLYWSIDNSIMCMDTINSNDIEHFKYIEQYINITNIEEVFQYCCHNNKNNIADYLFYHYLIHTNIYKKDTLCATFSKNDYDMVKYIIHNNNKFYINSTDLDLLLKNKNEKLLKFVLINADINIFYVREILDKIFEYNYSLELIQIIFNFNKLCRHNIEDLAIKFKRYDVMIWLVSVGTKYTAKSLELLIIEEDKQGIKICLNNMAKCYDYIYCAISIKKYDIAKFIYNYITKNNILLLKNNDTMADAIYNKCDEAIQWLYNIEYEINNKSLVYALEQNNNKLFIWLCGYRDIENNLYSESKEDIYSYKLLKQDNRKADIDKWVIATAAFTNNFDMVRWLRGYRKNDKQQWIFHPKLFKCPWDKETFYGAAYNMNIPMVHWLRESDEKDMCPFNTKATKYFTKHGRMDQLLWLRGYRKADRILTEKEIHDNKFLMFRNDYTKEEYEWIKYAVFDKTLEVCPFDEYTLSLAIEYGNIYIIQWLLQLPSSLFLNILHLNKIFDINIKEVYNYKNKNNVLCELSKHVFAVSLNSKDLYITKLLLDIGCPYGRKKMKKMLRDNPNIQWLDKYRIEVNAKFTKHI